MAKKQKSVTPASTEVMPPSLKHQAESIIGELEQAGETLSADIGKAVATLKRNLASISESAVASSTDTVKGVIAEVENLRDSVLEDLSKSLGSIKTRIEGESEPRAEQQAESVKKKKSKKHPR
jgi:hypothetical protein